MRDGRDTRPPVPFRTLLVVVLAGLVALTVAQAVARGLGDGAAADWVALSAGAGVGLASLAVLGDG
jgi:hypothetical protein